MRHTFQVDLHGLVELLSHHLYSSPRVFVRELLQNSVDAITARQRLDPTASARVDIAPSDVTEDGALRFHDTGIGLTESQVHELLATIGSSAKRDELGFSRSEFLGQFGIGLLSCFLVADEIEVETRSATQPDSETVVWRGYSDGRYTVTAGPPRSEPGTTVTLRPRPGCEHWLDAETVETLARHYGDLLPFDVRVGDRRVTGDGPPWTRSYPDAMTRRNALLDYGETLFGQRPFDVVDLRVPEVGLTGVAFVPRAESFPTDRLRHRVYLKRMLLNDTAERLLPDWAFFARCVVDTSELRPTASREQLYEDDLLQTAREALGQQLRDWLMDLATSDPELLGRFVGVHERGMLALALHDTEMLRLAERWVSFETTDGWMPLAEFRERHPQILYTATVEEFRQMSGIASAQGLGLVNGGYTYHIDIMRRLPRLHPDTAVSRLDPAELATCLDPVDPASHPEVAGFLLAAHEPLAKLGCVPEVRAFDPVTIPALFLDSGAW